MVDGPGVEALAASYDEVADEYARRIAGELEGKPFDRELLARVAERLRGRGIVCDLGCGPGHVGRYLHEQGLDVVGVDLSDGMLAEARRLHPGLRFQRGDMTALDDVPDGAWAGVVAFYSLIHVPPERRPTALREMRRVLAPDGLLLLAFHSGRETLHLDEWWGRRVSLDFFFLDPDEIQAALRAASFAVEETLERAPYADVEHPSRRAYLLARGV
jgi:SAM-dependent methyltransferase